MSKVKVLFYCIITALFISLGIGLNLKCKETISLKDDLYRAKYNYELLEKDYASSEAVNSAYLFSIEQLNVSKDSLVKELNNARKQLNIKDNEIQELFYLASTGSKVDTIYLKGEPIKEKVNIDTTISDYWYSLNLKVQSPNTMIVNPSFTSEKYIVTYSRDEVINPSKCKLINLFKKKHKILEVEIQEGSPYIVNNKEKFIKIINK